MKKIIYSIIFISMLVAGFTSCEIEHINNGDLDGYWHLETVDTLATGGVLDYSETPIMWSVQGNLLEFRGKGYPYIMHFSKSEQTLVLSDPCISDRTKGDPKVEEVTGLQPYGMNSIPATYTIEKLNSSHMVLSDGKLRLNLRKL